MYICIYMCIYTLTYTHFLCPFMYGWTLRLLPHLSYCKQCYTINAGVHVSFLIRVFGRFFSDTYPEVELLSHTVLFLIFGGTSVLFSIVTAPIYIPTNSARGLPSLHILTNTCYFLSFWSQLFRQVWGDISSWFWFAFPWQLVMWSIFSGAWWPSV